MNFIGLRHPFSTKYTRKAHAISVSVLNFSLGRNPNLSKVLKFKIQANAFSTTEVAIYKCAYNYATAS
ncbi:MAG: hypothetical protein J6W37_10250 [Bacteroidales bacterium]|nr:hypothetical protein [Bacteroidales bacterium]